MKIINQKEISFARKEMGTFEIKTQTEEDFYFAMGYAHAHDRITQLLLMRILGKGTASEHLVSDDVMLEMDIFFRKMNWRSGLEKEINKFSKEELKLAHAYCDGINKVILNKRPLHFKLFGYKPEPWTIADSMLISRMTGYISLAQSQGEIESFFIQLVQNGMSQEKVEELFPGNLNGCDFELLKDIHFEEKVVPDGVKWMSIASAAIASNNWVIDGSRSITGHPILANDPHLETNRLPNIWYELSISLNDRYFKGCTMPGLPACLIGRTNDLSWGATYTFMDAMDSWVEDVKDGKYLKNGERFDFVKRTETIKRKKKKDHIVTFYENEHGTVDGTPDKNGFYLTKKWASDSAGHQSIKAIREMFFAKDVAKGKEMIGQLEVSFNWVLADTQGNTGYQMSGLMPNRHPEWNGFYPAAGWDENYDWKGFVKPDQLPNVTNPVDGLFITCNQDLNEYGTSNPINVAMGDYRFRRVKDLILSKSKHDEQSFQQIQNDLYSIQAAEITPYFLEHITDENQKKILEDWDFNYSLDQIGPTLFEEIYNGLIHELLSANIGTYATDHILKETGILADFYLNFDRIIHNKDSAWFSSVSRDQMIKNALLKSENVQLKRWGAVNQFTMVNMFFGGKLPGFLGFDKGPVELRGGRSTVHQGQIYRSAGRETSFTPSYRFITDMSTNKIFSSLAGGASDNRWSKYYANEVDNWQRGIYKEV